jgi:hypothetical protein
MYMFWLRSDDGFSLQPKHVAVIVFVIIKAVCRRTTSLFLRVYNQNGDLKDA